MKNQLTNTALAVNGAKNLAQPSGLGKWLDWKKNYTMKNLKGEATQTPSPTIQSIKKLRINITKLPPKFWTLNQLCHKLDVEVVLMLVATINYFIKYVEVIKIGVFRDSWVKVFYTPQTKYWGIFNFKYFLLCCIKK